ncbi:hypothetical protein LMG29542_08275 [Paraburkholderia humisilvae]|uniref:Transposase n=1 Tax=Paraburkholderia humisilvae TaxID=627669 RepID=A0A6J5F940_9BURK|nr:hypothetical protein LMG29542_08275 [Paraburkholderia humisilvae]
MKALSPAVAKVLRWLHYPLGIMLVCVRWSVAYPLGLRNLEEWSGKDATLPSRPYPTEMMAERGIAVDHSTVHRWCHQASPGAWEGVSARPAATGGWTKVCHEHKRELVVLY